jgi:hypothetical protein
VVNDSDRQGRAIQLIDALAGSIDALADAIRAKPLNAAVKRSRRRLIAALRAAGVVRDG